MGFFYDLSHKYRQKSVTKYHLKMCSKLKHPSLNYLTNSASTFEIRSVEVKLHAMNFFHDLGSIHAIDKTFLFNE